MSTVTTVLTPTFEVAPVAAPAKNVRDFTWVETDEPHATRRRLILAKHPEIVKLFGYEPLTFPLTLLLISAQIFGAWYTREFSFPAWMFCVYVFSGTFNHSLQLAVHEITHNLCFESRFANRMLGIFANVTTCVPSATTFQKYHMEHHQFQGVDGVDTDVPTPWEVNHFTNSFLKVVWLLCQPLAYAGRPMFCKPKMWGPWEFLNAGICAAFNITIYMTMGIWSLMYMFIGTLIGMGLHPAAGHFVAEHYEFTKGYETYSYYGPFNYLNFNVGYHNEHHDFPKVPWSRLAKVKKMAPEFYDHLPCYTSYLSVFWRYITDPEIGPHSRVKRVNKTNDKKAL